MELATKCSERRLAELNAAAGKIHERAARPGRFGHQHAARAIAHDAINTDAKTFERRRHATILAELASRPNIRRHIIIFALQSLMRCAIGAPEDARLGGRKVSSRMDLDLTLVVQLIILLTVLVSVGNLLFKPFLQVIDLREHSIAGARKDGARLVAEAEAKDKELHKALDDTRRKAMSERAGLIAEAQKTERKILDDARASAQKRIDAARTELTAERAKTSAQLQATSKDLARSIASKVLLREVS